MLDPDDAARRVAEGDHAAFGELVAATTARLYRLAAQITGSIQDAEDVLQESYIRAFDSLRSSRFDGASRVETWLYRIVVNTSFNTLRARRRRRMDDVVDQMDIVDHRASAETTTALRELSEWLEDLPRDQRTALILKEIEGMSSAQVAQIMECSEGAIEQRLVRARATLRARSKHD